MNCVEKTPALRAPGLNTVTSPPKKRTDIDSPTAAPAQAANALLHKEFVTEGRRRGHLRLVPKPPAPAPDYPRIEVMISGRGWGRAGPFRLSERGFHELCAAARRLEARR